MRSILSISKNEALNNVITTSVQGKYQLIPAINVFQGVCELKKNDSIEIVILDIDDQVTLSMVFLQHVSTSWILQRPVVVLSGAIDKHTSEKLIKTGATALINKPFNPVELVRKIDDLMVLS